ALDFWGSFALVTLVLLSLDLDWLTTNAIWTLLLRNWALVVDSNLCTVIANFRTTVQIWISYSFKFEGLGEVVKVFVFRHDFFVFSNFFGFFDCFLFGLFASKSKGFLSRLVEVSNYVVTTKVVTGQVVASELIAFNFFAAHVLLELSL